jgi:Tol biopolymer transport system component
VPAGHGTLKGVPGNVSRTGLVPVPVPPNGPGNDAMPSWSHDGRWIYYNSVRSGQAQIWKIASDGRAAAAQITRHGALDTAMAIS